jgi:hypothetical protein
MQKIHQGLYETKTVHDFALVPAQPVRYHIKAII